MQHTLVVLTEHNEEEAVGFEACAERRRFPILVNQLLKLKRREGHRLLDVAFFINANSPNGNPSLNELLGGIAFNAEHAVNDRRPLRLVARILQPILLRDLAIGFTIVALDKSSYVAFEINGIVAGLDDALANARGTEHVGMEHVVHIRALERKGSTLRATVFNLAVSVLRYS